MSSEGPCTVLRAGGMRGLPSFNTSSSSSSSSNVFQTQQHQHQPLSNMAIRFGSTSSSAGDAACSAAWDDNDEPLPDIMSAPILRSVSSLVMSVDVDEGLPPSALAAAAAARNRNSIIAANNNSGSNERPKNGGAVSASLGSSMVDMLMTPLPAPPAPMNGTNNLTREQSFPPPFSRPRLLRDPSFPPPAQAGGLTSMDMLSSAGGWSSIGRSVAETETPNSGGGSMVASGGVFGTSVGGGGPSLSNKFQGLGFPGSSSSSTSSNTSGIPLEIKGQQEWEPDHAGGRGHGGGGTGGGSLGHGDHRTAYQPDAIVGGILPSSSSRQRRPSFDRLAAMIPGIPHWPTSSSPSPSSSPRPPPSGAPVDAGKLRVRASSSSSGTKAEQAREHPSTPTSRPTTCTPATAALSSSSSRGRQHRSARPGKKPKTEHLRRADSPPPARWTASTLPAAGAIIPGKKTPSSGTGKRGVEAPLSCGPASAGGGPVDLAKQERRRVKIQRYLYKRSRRKFAKSTRDASPSRSRPKAAALRPRVKGKFVKTAPDFISVNAGQPREAGGVGVERKAEMFSEEDAMPSRTLVAAGGVGVGGGAGARGGGGGGGGGGGVRSMRNGGSVGVSFDNDNNINAFSSTPSSSLMPRGRGGSVLPPPSSGPSPSGAPNVISWSARPTQM